MATAQEREKVAAMATAQEREKVAAMATPVDDDDPRYQPHQGFVNPGNLSANTWTGMKTSINHFTRFWSTRDHHKFGDSFETLSAENIVGDFSTQRS
jgi:hypothetical protein